MYITLIVLLFSQCLVTNANAEVEKIINTLHGNQDSPVGSEKILVTNEDVQNKLLSASQQEKITAEPLTSDGTIIKVHHLNDAHKQLLVHWVGENGKVVICLARDLEPIVPEFTSVNPSAVYISYDGGDTYENKTGSFKMSTGNFATLEKFYNHPKHNTHFVFTDVRHNLMYITADQGRNFKRLNLNFTPSDVSFHEEKASAFLVLDKNGTNQKLWVTEDFGENFVLLHEFVKSFFWIKDTEDIQQLVVQVHEPNGSYLNSIIYSRNLFKSNVSQTYATNVRDLFLKGDYLFITKNNTKGDLELYVSYKLGKPLLCVFSSPQKFESYYIIDVTERKAFIASSHTNNSTNLYVSENLRDCKEVKFTLSLENLFAYFSNTGLQDRQLHDISGDAFVDVYKVEGLSGIYIASKVISESLENGLGPQHVASVITFDHGATWRYIQPPTVDLEGQSTGCIVTNSCSLHLSQKFIQLHPDTRSRSILSSKSAPGVIIAAGVLGRNLEGHHDVYVSLDAGLTWRQTLQGLYFFSMGDYGGILTAIKYSKSKGETTQILYSIDMGEHWNTTEFHHEDIWLYDLMTVPGENTTVFSMFGSLPDAHRWIIVKVDLKNVFNRTCVENDYEMWSPTQNKENRNNVSCILGEQTTYQRRMPHAACLHGLDYVRLVSKQSCDCEVSNYECDFGFIKFGNPPRCIRDKTLTSYDPFKIPADCEPGKSYNRTKGYRKISGDVCVSGFESHYLPDQVPCPIQEVEDFILFAQRERISRFNLITNNLEELPVKNLKNVIALEFDMSTKCVYWADIALKTIGRQCFSNGSNAEILVSSNLSSIEGMALDWISKTLYFVDGVGSKIELIRIDINHTGRMRRTILDSQVLRKPRGIVLHPQYGYMFWTDWSIENPSVNRANLDGSNNITLFGREKVEWPNGITIDYIANRIYWVDAKRDYIGSSDLHGDGFLKVSDEAVISHPFAIAVFKNNMYWDDWIKKAIFSADKDNYRGVEVIAEQLPGLMDLKIFAHGVQIGTNACTNSSCPYICVGLPKNKNACLCPDGLILRNDKCMCPGNIEPLANMTCPSVTDSCSSDYFTCGNGRCIPKRWRCDNENDCGDGSDEITCTTDRPSCTDDQFHCISGATKCIPLSWKCDSKFDCSDGSDESDCKYGLPENCWSCGPPKYQCIFKTWVCDGETDCLDGSDEMNCTTTTKLT